jgi:hypothetical protein
MNCPAHLNSGPLTCTRTDPHDPKSRGGHVYAATAGSDLDNSATATPKHHADGGDQ